MKYWEYDTPYVKSKRVLSLPYLRVWKHSNALAEKGIVHSWKHCYALYFIKDKEAYWKHIYSVRWRGKPKDSG